MRLPDHREQELSPPMRQPLASRLHSPRGQTLVEFSLVILVFLVILMAIFDLGRGVFAYNSVTNAAREGARFAMVNQDTSLIVDRVLGQTFIAEAEASNVNIEFRSLTPNADFRTNPVCRTLSLNCVAVIRYRTTFQPVTPLIAGIVFPGGVTLEAQSVQAVEFVCPNSTTSSGSCPKQP